MLAGKLGAALIDKDVVSRAFAEAFVGTSDSTSADYDTRLRPAQYAALDAIAEDNLCAGVSAVIVAPYGGERATKKWRAGREKFASYCGARLSVVFVTCQAEVVREHIQQRNEPHDQRVIQHWDEYLATNRHSSPPAGEHFTVDNASGIDALGESAVHIAAQIRRGKQ